MKSFFNPAAKPSLGWPRNLSRLAALLVLLTLVVLPWGREATAAQPLPTTCSSQREPGQGHRQIRPVQRIDPADIYITVSDASATEGSDATIDFEVSLSRPNPQRCVEVAWATDSNTAVSGADYTNARGVLIFQRGETTRTISITLLDDSESEGVETFHLDLTNAVGGTFVNLYGQARESSWATGTILPDEDSDAPTVRIRTEYPITPPVSGFFKILVEFSEPVTGFETSDLQVTNGSVAEIQYTHKFNEHGMTKRRVTIVPDVGLNGDVSIRVPAGVVADSRGNSNTASEAFVIAARGHVSTAPKTWLRCRRYSDPDPASWATGPKSMSLEYGIERHFDGLVNVEAITLTNEEGENAIGPGFGTCIGPDPGDQCFVNHTILRRVTGQLTAQILAGAWTGPAGPTRPSNPVRISGADWAVSVTDASATEGTDATIDFEVRLNARDDCKAVKVDWATEDGTATAGEDYTASSGTLTFEPGENVKIISIPVLDDREHDSGEKFTLRLSNALGVDIADAEATGTIFNDEEPQDTVPPSVSVQCVNMDMTRERLAERRAEHDERLANGELVPLPYDFGQVVTEQYPLWWEFQFSELVKEDDDDSTRSMAIVGQDEYEYVLVGSSAVPGRLTSDGFRDSGRYAFTPLVSVWHNTASEVSGIVVSVPAGGWQDRDGNPNTASSNSVYLAHNWKVSVADASATEGADETIDFEVSLNARDDCKTVTVDWATEDGTATAGEDYSAASGTLTFGPGETTKTVSVVVLHDTVEDHGETFTLRLSNAVTTWLDTEFATIADAEATGTIVNNDSDALTARFENVPESHDGSTAFTFELHISENIGLSYRTVRDSMFDVSGAAVTWARRLTPGSNQGWRITVEPSAAGDIVISLPARACGETGAVCTSDGRTLSEGISETVQSEAQLEEPPQAALTARLENVPDSHDGLSAFEFEIHFNEEPHDLSYKTVRDALFDVVNGTVTKAKRLTRGSNLAFVVTVEPTAQDDIEISVRGTESCDAEHAVCAADGRMLLFLGLSDRGSAGLFRVMMVGISRIVGSLPAGGWGTGVSDGRRRVKPLRGSFASLRPFG